MSSISINHTGNDHSTWLKGLDFYKEEILIMKTRLAEVAMKNTSFEARQGVEHFQNQFILQRNNIDELKHNVNQYVSKLSNDLQQHAGSIDSELLAEKMLLNDQYDSF